ncbi:CLUMA_CG003254, isoform A [Clunio marinus]|uniref:CLUMA_CG003254, isoform A n=1 Tax=Clunio marinus TaxID=568069 RepID=A0A1J1HNT3_9DIPT|nr:CLUMA_CG003254, isoform A [Clunio marinus]
MMINVIRCVKIKSNDDKSKYTLPTRKWTYLSSLILRRKRNSRQSAMCSCICDCITSTCACCAKTCCSCVACSIQTILMFCLVPIIILLIIADLMTV